MKNKKLLMFPLILGLIIFQLIGCTYRSTVNGVDKSNSTKVSKVEFVKEYAPNYRDEVVVGYYKDTNGLYGRVYFKDVPDDTTKILFVWKYKNTGETLVNLNLNISPSENKVPVPCQVTADNAILPNGTYILETYQKDTNTLLNTTEIQVSK